MTRYWYKHSHVATALDTGATYFIKPHKNQAGGLCWRVTSESGGEVGLFKTLAAAKLAIQADSRSERVFVTRMKD